MSSYFNTILIVSFVTAWSFAEAQCNFKVTLTGKEVRCFGEANGEATINIQVTGSASGPYVIQWFDGRNLSFRNDLPAGTHFVKVTDQFGCAVTEFITIDQPRPLISSLAAQHIRCHSQPQGSINQTITGGTSPYFFQWSNGESTEDVTTLIAGSYTVNVTDNKGCVANAGITLTQPDPLDVSSFVSPVSCFGGGDGAIKATVFGGVQPYRYAWTTSDTIPDIFTVRAGTHTLTVTDANLCTKITAITMPQPQPLAFAFTVKKASCFDVPDGEVFVQVTGGNTPYRYAWSNASFVLGDTTNYPKNLYRDYYTLEVTDAKGCQKTDRVLVEEPNPLVINLTETDATCFEKPDGTIDLSINGGTLPYSILWSTGARQQDLSNLHSGDYSVVVVDVLGCTRYGKITVEQPDSLDFQFTIDQVSCKDQDDGRIIISPKGGTPQYSANWSTGETGFSIADLKGGTYRVTLTDAQQCAYEGEFVVPVSAEECVTLVRVPNTFTPNNDGINDVWVIRNYEVYPHMVVRVFNKWGKVVFSSTGYSSPWDGTAGGSAVQSGTYYYTINLNNGDRAFSGTLTILR